MSGASGWYQDNEVDAEILMQKHKFVNILFFDRYKAFRKENTIQNNWLCRSTSFLLMDNSSSLITPRVKELLDVLQLLSSFISSLFFWPQAHGAP